MIPKPHWLSKNQRFYYSSSLIWFIKDFMKLSCFSFKCFKLDVISRIVQNYCLSLIACLRCTSHGCSRFSRIFFVLHFIIWTILKDISWKFIIYIYIYNGQPYYSCAMLLITCLESFSWYVDHRHRIVSESPIEVSIEIWKVKGVFLCIINNVY